MYAWFIEGGQIQLTSDSNNDDDKISVPFTGEVDDILIEAQSKVAVCK